MSTTSPPQQQQQQQQQQHHGDDYDYSHLLAVTRQHGILMLLAWVFFVPSGIACSLLLRHRNRHPFYFFFRPHYILASTGVILAISGWILAKNNFHVDFNTYHGLTGNIVMWGALCNILLYMTMSLPRRENERFTEWPWYQKIGQMAHRITGYTIAILALATCATGIRIVSAHQQSLFWHGLFVAAAAASLTIVCGLAMDKYRFMTGAAAQRTDGSSVEPSEQTPLTSPVNGTYA